MRLAVVVALGWLTMVCAGCLEPQVEGAAGPECPTTEARLVNQTANVVYPPYAPDGMKDMEGRPRVEIPALQGQYVIAAASFFAVAGEVAIDYVGPTDHVDEVRGPSGWAWAAQGYSRGGNVSLELHGVPAAVRVAYSLSIQVIGCPAAV